MPRWLARGAILNEASQPAQRILKAMDQMRAHRPYGGSPGREGQLAVGFEQIACAFREQGIGAPHAMESQQQPGGYDRAADHKSQRALRGQVLVELGVLPGDAGT